VLEWFAGNVSAAAAVFMTEHPRAARRLLAAEGIFRDLEARDRNAFRAHPGGARRKRRDQGAASRRAVRLEAHQRPLSAAADTALDATVSFYRAALRQDAAVGEEL